MKQHITPEQLKELAPEQAEKLKEWWYKQDWLGSYVYYPPDDEVVLVCWDEDAPNIEGAERRQAQAEDILPILSIGQMIELLAEKMACYAIGVGFGKRYVVHSTTEKFNFNESELCDALWEAVKEVL